MLGNIFNFPKNPAEQRFNIHHPATMHDIATAVRSMTEQAVANSKDILVLCIGTDRSTGDALGPLTGSKLKTLNQYPHVFGTLDDPVHATNLSNRLKYIETAYSSPFVIAVDACLGKLDSVGCVSLGYGSVKPGAAVNKELPPVGDAYITGIVNVGGFMEHMVLQSTRLNLVVKMADAIAHGLSFGLLGVGRR